jgi:hypothetical protein
MRSHGQSVLAVKNATNFMAKLTTDRDKKIARKSARILF